MVWKKHVSADYPVRRSADLQSAVKKCPNLFGHCGFAIRNIQFVLFEVLLGDYKSPGFNRSNLFLRRISNPPGRLAGDFLLTPSGRLSFDAWRGTFFWCLAGDFLPLGARRICNPPLKNVLTFFGFADLQSATSSLCISTPGGNKRKKKGKQCCFPLF